MVMPPVTRIETAVRLGTNGNFLQRADKNASVWTKVTGSELGREKMCLPKLRGPAAPMPHELAPTHEEELCHVHVNDVLEHSVRGKEGRRIKLETLIFSTYSSDMSSF